MNVVSNHLDAAVLNREYPVAAAVISFGIQSTAPTELHLGVRLRRRSR
jgi:hypothetical protein